MPPPELRMSFADRTALAQEIKSNLAHGRAFVRDVTGITVLSDCVVVLSHPESGALFGLRGQAVLVSDAEPMRGVGVQLRPFDGSVIAAIEAFVAGDPSAHGTAEVAPAVAASAVEEQACLTQELSSDTSTEARSESDADSETDADLESDTDSESESDDGTASDLQQGPHRHEKLRKLSLPQQQKLARNGELNDRVLLERIFGRQVWEELLHNPKLTLPEISRIARKGSVPRPLLELIVENGAWIQSPLVRRALLTNPRVSSEAILKLLRITPKPELRMIYKTTTYSNQVREAARKVLEL